MIHRKPPTLHRCSHSKCSRTCSFAIVLRVLRGTCHFLFLRRYPAVQMMISSSPWAAAVDKLSSLESNQRAIVVLVSANDAGSATQSAHVIERMRTIQFTASGAYPTYRYVCSALAAAEIVLRARALENKRFVLQSKLTQHVVFLLLGDHEAAADAAAASGRQSGLLRGLALSANKAPSQKQTAAGQSLRQFISARARRHVHYPI